MVVDCTGWLWSRGVAGDGCMPWDSPGFRMVLYAVVCQEGHSVWYSHCGLLMSEGNESRPRAL